LDLGYSRLARGQALGLGMGGPKQPSQRQGRGQGQQDWSLAGLATGAAITSLVNNAAAVQSPLIVVPQTNYQLNYG